MNGLQLPVFDLEAPRRDSTTPYARRLREVEEQAFYEHFGRRPLWERVASPVTMTIVGAVAAVGAIFVALKETLGS
jgi:hypothetical protein